MSCTKSVSNEVPDDTIVRAWVECPECTRLERKEGVVGQLRKISVNVNDLSCVIDIAGQAIDPAVVVFSDDQTKPNPILEALSTAPPSTRFTLIIEVELPE